MERESTNTGKLDAVAQKLRASRQSNKLSGIPLASGVFHHGITDLPKLRSQEYPSVIVVIMVLLGMGSLYLPKERTVVVQRALVLLYLSWSVLKRDWIRRDQVSQIPKLLEW